MQDTNGYIFTGNSLTVAIDGKLQTMDKSHYNWREAVDALNDEDFEKLERLFDSEKAVEDFSDGNIEVKDGVVYYAGEVLNNHIVDRLISFLRQGLPYKPLVRFIDKLMQNPSRRAVQELYGFLEHKNMPLTENGNFLAYKGIDSNFRDKYSGRIDNSVGQTVQMPRNQVCDDANHGCSAGLHAGSYNYAKSYSSNGGHLVVVEIDPADVVSVPHDCEQQKLRTTKYKVLKVCETILEEELYDDDPYEDDHEEIVILSE